MRNYREIKSSPYIETSRSLLSLNFDERNRNRESIFIEIERRIFIESARQRPRRWNDRRGNEIKTTRSVHANYRHFLELNAATERVSLSHYHGDSSEEAISACSPASDTSYIPLGRKIRSLNCLRLSNQRPANCHLASELGWQGAAVASRLRVDFTEIPPDESVFRLFR